MFDQTQTRTLSRKFSNAIAKALDAFPAYLAEAEPDAAAEIIAGIIKTQLAHPAPQPEPADALAQVMRRVWADDTKGESK